MKFRCSGELKQVERRTSVKGGNSPSQFATENFIFRDDKDIVELKLQRFSLHRLKLFSWAAWRYDNPPLSPLHTDTDTDKEDWIIALQWQLLILQKYWTPHTSVKGKV